MGFTQSASYKYKFTCPSDTTVSTDSVLTSSITSLIVIPFSSSVLLAKSFSSYEQWLESNPEPSLEAPTQSSKAAPVSQSPAQGNNLTYNPQTGRLE